MRVFIAEDNPVELGYFKKLLSHENDITIVGEATDGYRALSLINQLKPDVVFLDINLPGLSGVEIGKTIDKNIKIVFITAHHDYALVAFDIGSVDYILKPIDEERFRITLNRLRKLWVIIGNEKMPIKIGSETIFVDICNITLIEKLKGLKKVAIYTTDSIFNTNLNLNSVEPKLSKLGFVRTHKSFLVNINRVDKMLPWGDKSYLIKLTGINKDVLVSRKYAPMFKSLLFSK